MAATCAYGDQAEELIRYQALEKASSSPLRQRLLMEPDITLQKVLQVAEAVETASREARGTVRWLRWPSPSILPRPTAAKHPRSGPVTLPRPGSASQPRPGAGATGVVTQTCFGVVGEHYANSRECPALKQVS